MNYTDVINQNIANHGNWARYAYHYTDIVNAIRILSCGKLYSRKNAIRRGLMKNDNAGQNVLDHTVDVVKDYVRFYFRPLTPTQFYNEGYKFPDLRFGQNANVPLPVFFVFNLEKMLQNPNIRFSATSLAGYSPGSLKRGVDNFSALPFDNIYSYGFQENREMVKYRHAELVCPNEFEVDTCLEKIIFRNEMDLETFKSYSALMNDMIGYDKKYFKLMQVEDKSLEVFERNGLFVESVETSRRYKKTYYAGEYFCVDIKFKFADTPERRYYNSYALRKTSGNPMPIQCRLLADDKEYFSKIHYQISVLEFKEILTYNQNLSLWLWIDDCLMLAKNIILI